MVYVVIPPASIDLVLEPDIDSLATRIGSGGKVNFFLL